ncbi:MAG: beta-ketoacyl synthase N-terminal-like domain-containing protein [Capnocytophaga sp.]|nr:beta-ketoacyl synthase N-terminal-like domain-containing protein [Capnocytophaga sp.]
MKKIYVNGISCISAQPTFSGSFLTEYFVNQEDNILPVIEPSYKEYIPLGAIRRMSKAVKMGIVASTKALKDAEISVPQAIIVGTGIGCIQDSEKFLTRILDNDEQHLTPTAFIQSTHNTVAGQIALNLPCKGLNFTFVNGATSFESAVLEAKMQLQQEYLDNALVGGIDENSVYTNNLYEIEKIIKPKSEAPFSIFEATQGVVFSEGTSFFVLSNSKNTTTYAELVAVFFVNKTQNITDFVIDFLSKNGMKIEEIDILISGRNGNTADEKGFDQVEEMFSVPKIYYKHLSGEYFTASSFGFWIACNVLKNNQIPDVLRKEKNDLKPIKNILLYNQFQGKDHSLILLRNV